MNSLFQKILDSENPTIPLLIDEAWVLDMVQMMTHVQAEKIEDCSTWNIPWVLLYEKSEEKKHLSIEDIRTWISDISSIPYEKKNIYILKDFDEATPEAMNATLKLLEEPPRYAIILLLVKNPEAIIETIRSRTLNYFRRWDKANLWNELVEYISQFHNNNPIPLLQYIQKEKIEKETAIQILLKLAQWSKKDTLDRIESWLISLYNINETPRNILDRVVLYSVDKK
jgi:DNA polymerase III gamma/tau subunit